VGLPACSHSWYAALAICSGLAVLCCVDVCICF
jgi:hypothetical protein